jgi:hypothetical protein
MNVKHAVLCLLLLSACELEAARNYRVYKLTWACLSPEGCERTQQVELIDRMRIIDGYEVIDFLSSRDEGFREDAQKVPANDLPDNCSWMYGLALFAHEIEPFTFCGTSGRFELQLSIPNREPTTQSKWLVEGRETDP